MLPTFRQLAVLSVAVWLALAACGRSPAVSDAGTQCLPENTCADLCVDTRTDPHHCGNCTTDCTTLPGVDPQAIQCVAGACSFSETACQAGKAHCSTTPDTGCETDVTTASDCGACGATCAEPAPLCAMDSTGRYVCSSGCTASTPVRCELQCVDTASDPKYCGGCSTSCPVPGHATAVCDAGACGFACGAPFADCDTDAGNGCEADTSNDVAHCGSCANACSAANGTPGCDAGTCFISLCERGYGDCNRVTNDGCEVALDTDPAHCGSCTNACSAANGTPGCDAGGCTIATCDADYGDCDNDPANGCELYLSVDPAHCGSCTNACSAANGTAGCASGNCTVASCYPDFSNCDANPANGCEVNLNIDPAHCGSCINACSAANGTAGCDAGNCTVSTCNADFGDCDADPANGCEVSLPADPAHCGSCTNTCTVANGTAGCASGNCTVASCDPDFADCDSDPANGCEVDLRTDAAHCGSCINACSAANGTAGCASSNCTVASCNVGWDDCDNLPGNGCEVDLTTSASDCGSCGNSCSALCSSFVSATTCSAGGCGITACSSGHFNVDGVCSTGCECASSGTSSSCASPTSLGTLQVGQTIGYTGNLVPLGQEAYLTVTFNGNTNTSYHPRVRLTAGATEFAFDVLTNCAGAALACGTEGGVSSGKTDWETRYTGGDPANAANFQPIPSVGSVRVRVYRRAWQPVTCNSYTLAITN